VNRLVEDNIALAFYHASKKYNHAGDHNETLSVAMEGLLQAAINFDDRLNVKFGTYASMRITWAFTRAWRKDMRARRGYGVSKISLDAEEDGGLDLAERLASSEKTPFDIAEIEGDIKVVLAEISQLKAKERKVIELRFGLSDCGRMTLEEASSIMGMTSERVRQIEAKALERLRCKYLGLPFAWDSGRNKPR
jgi:RNA polymerase sporulation-specific sigma factor